MTLREKLFLVLFLPASVAILLLFFIYVFFTYNEIKKTAIEEGRYLSNTIASSVADMLYYKDYDKIGRWLKNIPIHNPNLKDVLLLRKDGYLIATKRRGLVIFEKYKGFKRLKNLRSFKVVQSNGTFTFLVPVLFGDEIIGYVVTIYSFESLKEVALEHSLNYALILGILLLTAYVTASFLSARISKNISFALSLLKRIKEGEFDLPEPPKTGDEFEHLFGGIRETARRLKEVLISRSFYINVINSLSEGLLVLSKDFSIIDANLSLCRILKCSVEDIQGRNLKEVSPSLYEMIKDLAEKRRTGMLRIKVREGRHVLVSFTSTDDSYIVIFTDITELIKYEEKLKELAEKDPLTNIYNRRAFDKFLERELERMRRYRRPFSLVMFDLDHFKEINDTYGHQVGDEVLKGVADLIGRNLRKTDVFARWGGEEFMILLPETPIKNAEKFAEKIHNLMKTVEFEKVGKVTASFGVTEAKENDTVDEIIKRVDRAVYEAKKLGRNRIVSL